MLFGKHINRYYIKHLPTMLFGILALIGVDFMQLVIPELYRAVINGMLYGTAVKDGKQVLFDMNYLLDNICLPLIIVILCIVVGRFLWRICFRGSAVKMETDIRGRMFDRLKDMPQEYYHENKVGKLMSLFTNDLETVQECFGWGVLMFFDALFLCIMALIKMYKMNPLLTLFALIPMVFLVLIAVVIRKQLEQRWSKRQEAFSSLSDFSQETFSGIAVVKAFVKETVYLMSFRKLNTKNEDANVEHTKISTLLGVLVTLFGESVICVILGYGGYLTWNGTFDAGRLVEFIGYFTSIIWPIMAISQLIEMHSKGKASLKRISELLDAEPTVKDRENVAIPQSFEGEIEFKNLTFKYPNGKRNILDDVSFKINKGEHIGIIGKTGSGKTTLVDLILRTYNVPDRKLFISGQDVNSMPISFVREHISYVPQDNFLFSDTIENNISFSGTKTRDEVIDSAKLSDIHNNIIDFANGYDTVLGERGVTVSGGQKQRISIARALLKDADILILDDSVSAVDVKTEKIILDNLRETRKGKTTLLIAHRISTIQSMDKIIYIQRGKIIAFGTHEELYESCREYRNTVELQRLTEEGEDNE